MSLYATFEAIENTGLGTAIKESVWLFPAIESVHLLALATLGGAALIVDFSLLGVGLKSPPSTVERAARPWLTGALLVMILTGALLAVSEMTKLYDKPAYWVKMASLAMAVLFTYLVKLPAARREVAGWKARAVGGVSLLLWLTVAMAGRWIGFS